MKVERWMLYEAAARGIAQGRLARTVVDEEREPTESERKWARLAVDAALPLLEDDS